MTILRGLKVLSLVAVLLSISVSDALALSFASVVVDSSPVSQPEFNTASELLGPPDGEITAFEEVDSLTPGFVTVGFGSNFLNITGDDILVYLLDWTASDNEVFEALASLDGSAGSFVSIGSSGAPNGGVNAPVTLGFDLAVAGLDSAMYLQIRSSRIDPRIGEGPDIDAIQAMSLSSSPVPEPGTLALIGSGLGLLCLRMRRRH